MPQTGSRADPFGAFRFRVEIDGIATAAFTEVTGLSSSTDVIEYRTGNTRIAAKLPGLNKYANIVLKRGITRDRELWLWRKRIVDGKTDRRNGSIVLLADDGTEQMRISFRDGWPCKWEGPELNAKASDVAIETLEIAHEGFDVESG